VFFWFNVEEGVSFFLQYPWGICGNPSWAFVPQNQVGLLEKKNELAVGFSRYHRLARGLLGLFEQHGSSTTMPPTKPISCFSLRRRNYHEHGGATGFPVGGSRH
jgi:hypothetical protein